MDRNFQRRQAWFQSQSFLWHLLHCEDLLTPIDPQPVGKDLVTLTSCRHVCRNILQCLPLWFKVPHHGTNGITEFDQIRGHLQALLQLGTKGEGSSGCSGTLWCSWVGVRCPTTRASQVVSWLLQGIFVKVSWMPHRQKGQPLPQAFPFGQHSHRRLWSGQQSVP